MSLLPDVCHKNAYCPCSRCDQEKRERTKLLAVLKVARHAVREYEAKHNENYDVILAVDEMVETVRACDEIEVP